MNYVPMPCVWTLEKVGEGGGATLYVKEGGVEGRGRKKTAKSSRHSKAFLPMIGAFRQIHAPHPFQKNRCAYHWGKPPPHVPRSILDFLSRCGRAILHFIDAANQPMKDVHRIMAGECLMG